MFNYAIVFELGVYTGQTDKQTYRRTSEMCNAAYTSATYCNRRSNKKVVKIIPVLSVSVRP